MPQIDVHSVTVPDDGGNHGNPADQDSAYASDTTPKAPSPVQGLSLYTKTRFSMMEIYRKHNPSSPMDFIRPGITVSTINGSELVPNEVVLVLLYPELQPRWKVDKTIYVKTNLELLPEYADKKKTAFPNMNQRMAGRRDTPSLRYRPARKQKQISLYMYNTDIRHGFSSEGFEFEDWFVIDEIELFAANSKALALEIQANRWNDATIDREWAAIKLRTLTEDDWKDYVSYVSGDISDSTLRTWRSIRGLMGEPTRSRKRKRMREEKIEQH